MVISAHWRRRFNAAVFGSQWSRRLRASLRWFRMSCVAKPMTSSTSLSCRLSSAVILRSAPLRVTCATTRPILRGIVRARRIRAVVRSRTSRAAEAFAEIVVNYGLPPNRNPLVGEPTMTALSILELVRVTVETGARGALDNARDLAAHAERLGYRRIWVAEHHNMPGIASAATSIVFAHMAAGSKTIRVGAGGIMLPNHSPYVIAEQFGTLERLFPGRIDLGLGRAPGTDRLTLRALRRAPEVAEHFPQDVLELQAFLAAAGPDQRIQAVPAAGTNVPLWILGSSNFGAMLAAELGLPYAFASHFAPELLIPALQIYRTSFKPSEQLGRPYAMVGVNIIAAPTDSDELIVVSDVYDHALRLRSFKLIADAAGAVLSGQLGGSFQLKGDQP